MFNFNEFIKNPIILIKAPTSTAGQTSTATSLAEAKGSNQLELKWVQTGGGQWKTEPAVGKDFLSALNEYVRRMFQEQAPQIPELKEQFESLANNFQGLAATALEPKTPMPQPKEARPAQAAPAVKKVPSIFPEVMASKKEPGKARAIIETEYFENLNLIQKSGQYIEQLEKLTNPPQGLEAAINKIRQRKAAVITAAANNIQIPHKQKYQLFEALSNALQLVKQSQLPPNTELDQLNAGISAALSSYSEVAYLQNRAKAEAMIAGLSSAEISDEKASPKKLTAGTSEISVEETFESQLNALQHISVDNIGQVHQDFLQEAEHADSNKYLVHEIDKLKLIQLLRDTSALITGTDKKHKPILNGLITSALEKLTGEEVSPAQISQQVGRRLIELYFFARDAENNALADNLQKLLKGNDFASQLTASLSAKRVTSAFRRVPWLWGQSGDFNISTIRSSIEGLEQLSFDKLSIEIVDSSTKKIFGNLALHRIHLARENPASNATKIEDIDTLFEEFEKQSLLYETIQQQQSAKLGKLDSHPLRAQTRGDFLYKLELPILPMDAYPTTQQFRQEFENACQRWKSGADRLSQAVTDIPSTIESLDAFNSSFYELCTTAVTAYNNSERLLSHPSPDKDWAHARNDLLTKRRDDARVLLHSYERGSDGKKKAALADLQRSNPLYSLLADTYQLTDKIFNDPVLAGVFTIPGSKAPKQNIFTPVVDACNKASMALLQHTVSNDAPVEKTFYAQLENDIRSALASANTQAQSPKKPTGFTLFHKPQAESTPTYQHGHRLHESSPDAPRQEVIFDLGKLCKAYPPQQPVTVKSALQRQKPEAKKGVHFAPATSSESTAEPGQTSSEQSPIITTKSSLRKS